MELEKKGSTQGMTKKWLQVTKKQNCPSLKEMRIAINSFDLCVETCLLLLLIMNN